MATASPPPPSKAPVQVTPPSVAVPTVDKEIIDELLLVCGVIGTADEDGHLVPVADCLNWLQDLQRALRRDEDLYRPISLLLGQWKVVAQKLLPLVDTCRYDSAIVLTVAKILVMLTKPLAANTIRAGKMVINTNKKKVPEAVRQEQIKLKENAIQQAEQLVAYKRLICHHPSYRKQGDGILSVFVSLLAEPLAKSNRTDADHLTIEVILHLFRNLIAAEPLLSWQADPQLHHEFIHILDQELVLQVILVLASDLEQRENQPYNLLLMEILHHLFQYQDPTAVAQIHTPQSTSLRRKLLREKQSYGVVLPSRHAHFGKSLVAEPRRRVIKPTKDTVRSLPRQPTTASTPAARQAQRTLHSFCETFFQDAYGPVMKSLKNEFRRDSVRLEESDKVLFFRLVWFLGQWWRPSKKKDLGPLIFTMDVFSFNLVLNAMDHYVERKQPEPLAQAVALYGEMMHQLWKMYQANDKTLNIMAHGLMDRLFYGNEALDRLPKLLSKWKPGTSSRDYLCDLAEVCHMQLKLLEANASVDVDREAAKHDTVAKMKAAAADFDVQAYASRKIISNNTVVLYTELLSHYASNPSTANHRTVAFFTRISKISIAVAEKEDPDMPKNPLALKSASMEPILYNVPLLSVCDQILNDASIRGDDNLAPVLQFATSLVRNFARAAAQNPMLFVEALIKHSYPNRYCENVANCYVSDELRMIAEKDLLMEHQEKLEAVEDASDSDDDDDDELEFEDFGVSAPPPKASVAKRTIDDSDDDEEAPPKAVVQRGILADSDDEDELPAPTQKTTIEDEDEEPENSTDASDETSKDTEESNLDPAAPEETTELDPVHDNDSMDEDDPSGASEAALARPDASSSSPTTKRSHEDDPEPSKRARLEDSSDEEEFE